MTPGDTATATAGGCDEIPEETAGPYPGDGSNGPNVLVESGIVRGDIRSSFGDANGTAEGVPATVTLTIQDAGNDCGPLQGAAVYLWPDVAAGAPGGRLRAGLRQRGRLRPEHDQPCRGSR